MDIEYIIQTLAHINLHLQTQETRKEEFSKYYCEALLEAQRMLREFKNEKERNPVIVCPHCGKRVK